MEIIPANQADVGQLTRFLNKNDGVEKDMLQQKGYVVIIKDQIEGCFVLDSVDEDNYWLKQLYITKNEAASLPVLLESVLALAKQKMAKTVYVHSHQPMVDVLLEALQFYPQKENDFVDNHPIDKGNWWTYQVS